ncbi:MAG: hypothetical protein U1F09_15900 [Steroidobacteraceae bacterium]
MRKSRSGARLVYGALDVKGWLERTPSVEEARPGRCPRCEAASRPAGRALGLWGHGVRERQQRGPLEPFGEPVTVVVQVRRYVCRACRAVVQVVPRGVVAWRLFSAAAIGLALTLFGVGGCAMSAVRERVSPWRHVGASAVESWLALRRWIGAIREGRLFTCVRPAPACFTARQMAERAAMTLGALAPDLTSGVLEARVFAGAALAR